MSLPFYLSYVALWILVAFQSLVLLGLVRAVYRLQRGPYEAGQELRGKRAPSFRAVDLSDSTVDSSRFAGELRALLFVSPDCSSCSVTLDELEALKLKTNDNVVVVCRAGRDECLALAEEHVLSVPVLVDEDREISRLYQVAGSPTAVLIGENDRILTVGHPMRGDDLAQLFEESPAEEASVVE